MGHGRSRTGGLIVASGLFVVALAVAAVVAYLMGAFGREQQVESPAEMQGVGIVAASFSGRMDSELSRKYYAYSQLDDDGKRRYRIMFEAVRTRERRSYPESGEEELSRIRACVVADHPELFYADGVSLETSYDRDGGEASSSVIEGTYTYSAEEQQAVEPLIERAVADFISTVPADADAYGKAKMAYEYVIANTVYDHGAIDAGALDPDADGPAPGQTMADVFVDNVALCAGYSAAYQYLMQQMGYQCTQLRGTADGVGHAWCLLQIDGDYYLVDPTWGDPQFIDSDVDLDPLFVNYDYLCVTSDDMAPTHVLDGDFTVVDCTSSADNYFVREGLVFYEADAGRLGALVSAAEQEGAASVQIRCSDWDIYQSLLEGFVMSGDLGSYLSDGEYRYLYSDEMRTMAICP